MERVLAALGTVAVIAGPAGAAVGQVNPKVGAVIAAAGGVALAVTAPLVDARAKLDARRQKKARRRAAARR